MSPKYSAMGYSGSTDFRARYIRSASGREEIVGEPLQLEDRKLRQVGGLVGPHRREERVLPPDRAVAGDPVDDPPSERWKIVGLGTEDVRVPGEQVVGIVRVGAVA